VLLLPLLIQLVLPRYAAGIVPAQVLVYGANFLILRYSLEPFFVALSKLYRTFLIQGVAIAIGTGGALLAMAHGYGLTGVAASTTLSYVATSTGLLWYAHQHFARPKHAAASFVVSIHLPAAYCGVLLLGIAHVLPVPAAPTWRAADTLLGQLAIYLVLCLPVLARAGWWKFGKSRAPVH